MSTIQRSVKDRRRVVVATLDEPWKSIVERAQNAGFDPTLDKVREVHERNQRRAGR